MAPWTEQRSVPTLRSLVTRNDSEGCCHKVCFHFHVLYNNHGGTFSRKECEHERECASPTKRAVITSALLQLVITAAVKLAL